MASIDYNGSVRFRHFNGKKIGQHAALFFLLKYQNSATEATNGTLALVWI